MDRQEASQALASASCPGYLSRRAAINQLPQELMVIIFHLCLDVRETAKVLTRLVLVCRWWKAIVEGMPSFWTRIKAADGLRHARNAITKTGESPIDLNLSFYDPVSVDAFLVAVGEKVSHWRSVELTFQGDLPTSFGGLQTSSCHSLEKLSLTWYGFSPATSLLTLFDGEPAPHALKEVSLYAIPANLGPMGLSQLSSLVLIDVPYLKMDDLLLILRNSPTLTTLHLRERGGLHQSGGTVGQPIILGSLTACNFDLSTPLLHFVLSEIHAPSLDHLKLALNTEDSFPDASIFSPPVSGFKQTLKRLASTAKHINLEFGEEEFSITFGGLKIFLTSPDTDGFRDLRDVLDTLMGYSGEKGKDLKVRLYLDGVNPSITELQNFNACPMVEELVLSGGFWTGTIPVKAIEALGTPIPTSPRGWLFPELEIIRWNMDPAGSVKGLEKALGVRYVQPELTRQANERQHPRLIKEIRFLSKDQDVMEPRDWEETLRRVHVLTGGARIFSRDCLVDFDTVVL